MSEPTATSYLLAPNADVQKYLAYQGDRANVSAIIARVEAWFSFLGFTIGPRMTTIDSLGRIEIQLDRDPAAAWEEFDPRMAPTEYEQERNRRQFVRDQIPLLKAGTATAANVQRVVAWLADRELRVN
jgi:hypothetical protein